MKAKNLTLTLICAVAFVINANSQDETEEKPAKGSYLYHGQPEIEDNSFLIEEAFNQEAGIIQHIQNYFLDHANGDFVYNYTQEIPLDDYRHQFSFTIFYPVHKEQIDVPGTGSKLINTSGVGDLFINYRPLLWGKKDWALVIPRFTLIIPTGSSKSGFGAGGWGGQFNLAVTKRLSKKITTHYNTGYTYLAKADRYNLNDNNQYELSAERNLNFYNLGTSVIYSIIPRFNLMTEYLVNFESDIETDGSVTKSITQIINPGLRFAINYGKIQIVPGLSIPYNINTGKPGIFGYLSIEADYSKLGKK